MKIYIISGMDQEQTWWTNFRLSLDDHMRPGYELEKRYNARYSMSSDGYIFRPYIEFRTEAECTAFLLRWS